MARSLTDLFIPGRAVAIDGERSDEKLDGEALVEQSLKLTAGLKELVQENKDLKEELHQLQQKPRLSGGDLGEQDHAQTIQEIQQRHEENITRMKGHLKAKEDEVESLKRRLAAMSERKVNQDQRMTENTLSINRPSEMEREYIDGFKDGKRVDATEIIERKLPKSSRTATRLSLDHLKASRLACLIFEVSYEVAVFARKNFKSVSSLVLGSLINKAPSIAFVDPKKPLPSDIFPPKSSSSTSSVEVQEVVKELMVLIKETATEHKLDKIVETVKSEVLRKWKTQLNQQKETRRDPSLPNVDDKLLNDGLERYINYCCRFSWRLVTQVPPLKISYYTTDFDPICHVESTCFAGDKRPSPKIKCFLWPTLLDCDNRVIAKGEVLLSE